MDELSATDAARRFSDLLDAVEHRGETFVISRKGKPVALVGPTRPRLGRDLKRFLRNHPPDDSWARELSETRSLLVVEDRRWGV
jgi:prevent-host-death family protein